MEEIEKVLKKGDEIELFGSILVQIVIKVESISKALYFETMVADNLTLIGFIHSDEEEVKEIAREIEKNSKEFPLIFTQSIVKGKERYPIMIINVHGRFKETVNDARKEIRKAINELTNRVELQEFSRSYI